MSEYQFSDMVDFFVNIDELLVGKYNGQEELLLEDTEDCRHQSSYSLLGEFSDLLEKKRKMLS